MRRIIGFIGLVLLFTNCVTLFHSARVLEPGEYEVGASLGYSELFTKSKSVSWSYQFFSYSHEPNASKIFTLTSRVGWGNGFVSGVSYGLCYADAFISKSLIRESNSYPSMSIVFDAYYFFGAVYTERGIYLSSEIYKSQVANYYNFNPTVRARAGFVDWTDSGWPTSSQSSGERFEINLFYGNEMHNMGESWFMPYLSVGLESKPLLDKKSFESIIYSIDFGLSVFFRS
ncbi:MAG: hypothetical protein AB7T10_02455 [bacterium]